MCHYIECLDVVEKGDIDKLSASIEGFHAGFWILLWGGIVICASYFHQVWENDHGAFSAPQIEQFSHHSRVCISIPKGEPLLASFS